MAQEKPSERAELTDRPILNSPLSVIKLDLAGLRDYTNRLRDFLTEPGAAAIKICECCIKIE